jgi:Tfp pilus assembly protein FimV
MSTMVITDVATTDELTPAPRLRLVPAPETGRASGPAIRPVERPARRHGHLRLTRRGRAVVFLAGLVTLLAVAVFAGAGSVATDHSGRPAPTTVVKVAPGETLWSIAAELTPSGDDVRDTMFEIQRLNALDSVDLAAGQRIRVPAAH